MRLFFMQRWFVDGSVKCFTGGHLPLAIMAILILMFYILLIIFVTAVVLKKVKVSHHCIVIVTVSIHMYITCVAHIVIHTYIRM